VRNKFATYQQGCVAGSYHSCEPERPWLLCLLLAAVFKQNTESTAYSRNQIISRLCCHALRTCACRPLEGPVHQLQL
jgi:hypothetical protein